MIAFLDVEYNCDSDKRNKRTDFSMIEVALVVTENLDSANHILTYRSYVKPKLNNGLIYSRITELTGIKQENVDSAPTFPEVFAKILEIIETNNIEKIYTWSSADGMVFRWNCKLYDPIPGHNKFIKMIKDASAGVEKEFAVKWDMSLLDAAHICNCKKSTAHNALDDAKMLRNVVRFAHTKKYSKNRLEEYKKYYVQKRAFGKLKNVINEIQQAGGDVKKLIKLALEGKDFPA